MLYNKHLAKSLEKQQVKQTRQFYHALAEVNLQYSEIHQILKKQIDISPYKFASDYVDQYISYTTIWNLKFVYNLENPEVALLQTFHIQYILDREPSDSLTKIRMLFEENSKKFFEINPFKQELVEKRYNDMLQFIQAKQAMHE
jgi:hypothetical protein